MDVDAFLLPDAPTTAGTPSTAPAGPATRRVTVPAGDDADEQPLELQYETMAAWFKGWFHQVIERQQTQAIAWCPQWWSHPEVVSILDALWIAWEGAAASPHPMPC